MLRFIFRRLLVMIPTLFVISVVSFLLIQLPPGDFLTSYVARLMAQGDQIRTEQVEALRGRYGLGDPIHIQYIKWMGGVLQGDLGYSLNWRKPVTDLILERLPWSVSISLLSFLLVWLLGIPIAVYSATHKYSMVDYVLTLIAFIGLAIPGFLLALVAMWITFSVSGQAMVGLYSREFLSAPWSFAKFLDLLKHMWIPALILGPGAMGYLIRTMRANLLDELEKPYVMVARSKGLTERRLLFKYPFRVAINPSISTIGWTLPYLLSGELLVSVVLGLPTMAPLFVDALLSQDMFLAGSIVMILSVLTVIGTLISDILLAWVDPRIRAT